MVVDTAALLSALINTGGMGGIAAVLLFLHYTSLRTFEKRLDKQAKEFRDELKRERDAFRDELEEERRQCHDDHEKLAAAQQRSHDLLITMSTGASCRAAPWSFGNQQHDKQS